MPDLDAKLVDAVVQGDFGQVQQLVAAGANPNATNVPTTDCTGQPGFEMPPVVAATIDAQKVEILRWLLGHGGDLNVRSQQRDCPFGGIEGRTPLLEAAYRGVYTTFKVLLDAGADVNATTLLSKYTALTYAIGSQLGDDGPQIAGALFDRVSPATLQNGFQSLFLYSINEKMISAYLGEFLKRGIDINSTAQSSSGSQFTILCQAAHYGSQQLLEQLLSLGADANAKCTGGGPLFYALSSALSDKSKRVELLLKGGAKPALSDVLTAMQWSAKDVVTDFLSKGVDINGVIDGRPLLFVATDPAYPSYYYFQSISPEDLSFLADHGLRTDVCYQGICPIVSIDAEGYRRPEYFAALAHGGASLNFIGGDGLTILATVLGSRNDADGGVEYLLDHGADTTLEGPFHGTALFYFFYYYTWEKNFPLPVVTRLIEASKPVVNLANTKDGRTPLLAYLDAYWQFDASTQKADWTPIGQALLAAGADVNLTDPEGTNALMKLACLPFDGVESIAREVLAGTKDRNAKNSAGQSAADLARNCIYGKNTKFLQLLGVAD